MALNFYEDLRRPVGIGASSDRQFGLVISAVFAILGFWPMRRGDPIREAALAVAGAFLAIAVVRPTFLHPLNRLWSALGLLLGRIVNPVVTAIAFFVVFTPAGLISRMLGRDPLRLKSAPGTVTYWIGRQPPGPQPETMSRRF